MTNTLVHFLGKEPSIFRIMDDLTDEDELIEATALELEPRAVDQGRASYWECSNETEERHIAAGFAARRRSRQRLGRLRLRRVFLESVGLAIIHDPDYDTFACIAEKHRLIDLASHSTRRRLAEAIWEAIYFGQLKHKEVYIRVTKGNIKTLIAEVYDACIRHGEEVELEKAADWARAFLEEERNTG